MTYILWLWQVTIHHLVQIQKESKAFLPVMRRFRVYSLSNFRKHHIEMLTLICCILNSFYLLIISFKVCTHGPTSSKSPNPKSDNHKSVLFFHVFGLFLDSKYKWNHTVSAFLQFISLSIISSESICLVTKGRVSFLFMDDSIELCVYLYLHIFFTDTLKCDFFSHIFFLHSSVNGRQLFPFCGNWL